MKPKAKPALAATTCSAMEERALAALIAVALRSDPSPPSDEDIDQFMREWDEGKHRLSAEDEAALDRARKRFPEMLREAMTVKPNAAHC